MTTRDDRAQALEPLGFTPRQARFLAIVALHGGYCLRRQYAAWAGLRYGKNVRNFLDALVDRQLAERFHVRADRGRVYHLHSWTLYRVIGQEDNRNRRDASAALMAGRLMLLDFVLAHRDVEWVVTEADKLELFADRFRVCRAAISRVGCTRTRGRRRAPDALLSAQAVRGGHWEPAMAFAYLAAEQVGGGFDAFLHGHAGLFGRLSTWTVVAIGPPGVSPLMGYDAAFERFLAQPAVGRVRPSDDLRWYLATRQERDELARLSVTDINRFRALREQFRGATFDAVYADWRQDGDTALASGDQASPVPRRSVGRLVIETLPFDYTQFGSLPGVA